MFRVIVICVFFSNYLQAQEDGALEHAMNHKYNPIYRVNYFDKMILKVDVNSEEESFQTKNFESLNSDKNIFHTNQKLNLRLSFDYDFLGLFISTSPNFLQEKGNGIAQTKTLDLSFKFFYSDRLRQEIDYKNRTGYYLDDNSGRTFSFPELNKQTIGGRTFYILNNNFSYRAFENLTERQLISAGSFIPSIGYYFNKLIVDNNYNSFKNLSQINSFDFMLQMGYMYNLVIDKRWVGSFGIHPGIGVNYSQSTFKKANEDLLEETKRTNFNYNYKMNFSIGYNGKNIFSGIKYNYQNFEYDTKYKPDLVNTRSQIEIYVGHRFNASKSIKQVFKKINDIF
ncbi:DUF4421 family protein [Flavobacterium sp.]|uniref:DUF4421 family protein n=1 Tax=Flavobacterium sp. TaxID=239 RepID=UPI003C3C6C92